MARVMVPKGLRQRFPNVVSDLQFQLWKARVLYEPKTVTFVEGRTRVIFRFLADLSATYPGAPEPKFHVVDCGTDRRVIPVPSQRIELTWERGGNELSVVIYGNGNCFDAFGRLRGELVRTPQLYIRSLSHPNVTPLFTEFF